MEGFICCFAQSLKNRLINFAIPSNVFFETLLSTVWLAIDEVLLITAERMREIFTYGSMRGKRVNIKTISVFVFFCGEFSEGVSVVYLFYRRFFNSCSFLQFHPTALRFHCLIASLKHFRLTL